MIDLLYWTTPNGHKATICLEEMELPYRIVPVDLSKGEQHQPDFLRVSPNNKIPAIIDHTPLDAGGPVELFESGAILLYLAQASGRFLPASPRGRAQVAQWLFWQVGGLGPMAGQLHYFRSQATQHLPPAIEHFDDEVNRLYSVLDAQLANHAFLAGNEYTIADMSAFTWSVVYELLAIRIEKYPHVRRWLDKIAARPAVVRAYRKALDINPLAPVPPMIAAAF